ncbi:unnamed protein product [Rotaria sordida]|uniref:Uncharacterized protein n=1 Tax=Rotaria sordida TaxID=392033 RepID=A0A813V2V7_9BILA|nr:unnamed protein product [Rotaria sordida]CAF1022816.1 unnamed protein product [Rotaria sordida]CAF3913223.1 unnamed protein product [Rotaria sordida]CAF4058769.1 unnamed protein product [Rotaria sordida]
MSTSPRLLVRKNLKGKKESHVIIGSPTVSTNISSRTPLLTGYDYQVPRTAHSLAPQSKWIIVRNNLHQIRNWNAIELRHELKRVQEKICAIQYRLNFKSVHYFYLPTDEIGVRRYNVSHVQPTDSIYYAGLGSEPINLQCLLHYFSKECIVLYNSLFYPFLCDVNSVLDTNRKRIHRVVASRKVPLIMTVAIFTIILMMFFSLILSVLTTTSNLRQMYKNSLNDDMT